MNNFRPKSLNDLDDEIGRLVSKLSSMPPEDEDYTKVAKNLQTLMDARERRNDRVISADAIFAASVNIASLLLVLYFEQTGVITSKAFSLIGRKVK